MELRKMALALPAGYLLFASALVAACASAAGPRVESGSECSSARGGPAGASGRSESSGGHETAV